MHHSPDSLKNIITNNYQLTNAIFRISVRILGSPTMSTEDSNISIWFFCAGVFAFVEEVRLKN